MSRTIDKVPDPTSPSTVKVVVASCSRTATLGVYQALKILGYRTYHLYELALFSGDPHWEFMIQGLRAQHNRLADRHLQPRYTKKEFDKWFDGYDALVEVPSYFDMDCLEAYAEDPEVKFILTERSPRSWANSVNKMLGGIVKAIESPPLNVLKYFSKTLGYFAVLNVEVYNLWADGSRPGDPGNEAALMKNYERYIRDVKRTIPAERMLVVKIEDGLGWEQICPFLGREVPKGVAYPRGVEHKDIRDKWLKPLLLGATVKLGLTLAVPVALGAMVWSRWFR